MCAWHGLFGLRRALWASATVACCSSPEPATARTATHATTASAAASALAHARAHADAATRATRVTILVTESLPTATADSACCMEQAVTASAWLLVPMLQHLRWPARVWLGRRL